MIQNINYILNLIIELVSIIFFGLALRHSTDKPVFILCIIILTLSVVALIFNIALLVMRP